MKRGAGGECAGIKAIEIKRLNSEVGLERIRSGWVGTVGWVDVGRCHESYECWSTHPLGAGRWWQLVVVAEATNHLQDLTSLEQSSAMHWSWIGFLHQFQSPTTLGPE
jgi:hypothetical protein